MYIKISDKEFKHHSPEYFHTDETDEKDRKYNETLSSSSMYHY